MLSINVAFKYDNTVGGIISWLHMKKNSVTDNAQKLRFVPKLSFRLLKIYVLIHRATTNMYTHSTTSHDFPQAAVYTVELIYEVDRFNNSVTFSFKEILSKLS